MLTKKDIEKSLSIAQNFMRDTQPLSAAEHATATLRHIINDSITQEKINHPSNDQLGHATRAFNALTKDKIISVADAQLLLTLIAVRQTSDEHHTDIFKQAALYHASNLLTPIALQRG